MIRAAIVGMGWWGRTLVEAVADSDVIRVVAGATRTVSPEVTAFAEAQKLRLAADLTALLRIELAHWGLRDPAKDVDYRMARSVLMQLADLGGAFDALGQILLSGRGRPAAPSAGIGTNGYGGTGLLH